MLKKCLDCVKNITQKKLTCIEQASMDVLSNCCRNRR